MSIDDIIKKVDKSWPKNYIIRFLYVNLAQFLERDLEFFLSSSLQKSIELSENINRFPCINCSTLSDFYIDTFKSFNINAIKIKATPNEIPLYSILVEGDNGWFYLCPINDLLNCQIGNRTSHFGHLDGYIKDFVSAKFPNLIEISSREIATMDKNLGIKDLTPFWNRLRFEMFNSEYFYQYFNAKKNDSAIVIKAKLDFISKYLINIPVIPGPLEREAYYRFLVRRICSHNEYSSLKVGLDLEKKSVNVTNIACESPITFEEKTYLEKNKRIYVLERKK